MTAESLKKGKSKTPAKKTPSKKATEKVSSRKPPKEIRWRVFLAPEHPWKTVIILLLLTGIILVIGKYVYDIVPGEATDRILPAILAGILVFLLFFGSFNLYFIPVDYHITQEEIVIKKFYHTDRREWNTFRRFFLTRSGVVLSTFATRKRFLDNFRGVQLLLPTDTDERKKVLSFIEARLPLDPGQHRE
jgi:hypothetical protein